MALSLLPSPADSAAPVPQIAGICSECTLCQCPALPQLQSAASSAPPAAGLDHPSEAPTQQVTALCCAWVHTTGREAMQCLQKHTPGYRRSFPPMDYAFATPQGNTPALQESSDACNLPKSISLPVATAVAAGVGSGKAVPGRLSYCSSHAMHEQMLLSETHACTPPCPSAAQQPPSPAPAGGSTQCGCGCL